MLVELVSDPMGAHRRAAEPIVATGRLDPRLGDLLDEGLVLDDGGLYFARWPATNGRTSPYHDPTGREPSVNSFHLDCHLFDTAQSAWAPQCVGHGFLLAQAVLTRAAELRPPCPSRCCSTSNSAAATSFPRRRSGSTGTVSTISGSTTTSCSATSRSRSCDWPGRAEASAGGLPWHAGAGELGVLYQQLKGEARLSSLEDWLDLTISGGGSGRLEVSGAFLDRPDGNELRWRIDGCDQTFLPPLMTDLADVLAAFPVLGRPSSVPAAADQVRGTNRPSSIT